MYSNQREQALMEKDLDRNQNIFWIVLFSALILYFLYHIMMGRYGLVSYIQSQKNLVKKKKAIEQIEKDMSFIQNKIDRMSDNSVDPDILDEEAKNKLGYAKENEIVIYTKDLEKL